MNLEKVENSEKLNLCRKYFYGGCFALPFVWFVNVLWFFRWAFLKPEFTEQPQIRKYVIRSAIGSFVWTIAIIVWNVYFQMSRASWGASADYISFTIPKGVA